VQAVTMAESSTLKAALDTYLAETPSSDEAGREQLLTTIARELKRVAARVEDVDAVVAVDLRQKTIAAAGPFADRWPRGRAVPLAPSTVASDDGVARVDDHTFRIVTVPLVVNDERIGALYLATSLDANLARELDALSDARIAVVSGRQVLATTLSDRAAGAADCVDLSAGHAGDPLDRAMGHARRRRLIRTDAVVRHQRRLEPARDTGPGGGRRRHTDARAARRSLDRAGKARHPRRIDDGRVWRLAGLDAVGARGRVRVRVHQDRWRAAAQPAAVP
jgi:hypothetical protein